MMIEIKNITKKFENVVASNNLCMNLESGIYGLVGENGAGKSTLLRLIANVIYPNEGEILIDGIPNEKKEAKEKIFFLPDDPYVKPSQTIVSIYDFYESFYDIDKDKFMRIIRSCNLDVTRKVSTFSKGMKRQVFIALALSIRCKYLLMDEAFDGLDPLIMSKIKDNILNLKEEGKCVIIASHNINTLNQIADRILLLCKGSLSKNGEVEDMAFELRKYQIATESPLTKDSIDNLGFHVVSFKKIGSIYHVVIQSSDEFVNKFTETYHPLILEEIALDPEEVVMLNMMMAKEDKAHE
jgi:ABC-2 type transport system ATP-binding protein